MIIVWSMSTYLEDTYICKPTLAIIYTPEKSNVASSWDITIPVTPTASERNVFKSGEIKKPEIEHTIMQWTGADPGFRSVSRVHGRTRTYSWSPLRA